MLVVLVVTRNLILHTRSLILQSNFFNKPRGINGKMDGSCNRGNVMQYVMQKVMQYKERQQSSLRWRNVAINNVLANNVPS